MQYNVYAVQDHYKERMAVSRYEIDAKGSQVLG